MAEYEDILTAEAQPIDTENIGNLAQLMVSELVGCPDLLVRQQLQKTLREFCKRTEACTVAFGCVAEEGVVRYRFGRVPCDMRLGSLHSVSIGGRSLQERYHYTITGNDLPVVEFAPGVLNNKDNLEFIYSVIPKIGGETCPEWFKERYADAIVAGAMFYLLKMTGKPWADAARMQDYAIEYNNAINEASYKRMMGSQISNASGGMFSPPGGIFI